MELMIESFDAYEDTNATPAAARISERPVDLVHLARYTLGDAGTEREVLSLFRTQSQFLLQRLKTSSDQPSRQRAAQTLKDSARGIGAWRVAMAADQADGLERLQALEHRIDEANRFIGALLANA
jgi:hypothetical protein